MFVIVSTILGLLLRPIVFRVLAFLGIGLIVYNGAEIVIEEFAAPIRNSLSNLPPQLAQVFGILQIDIFATLIISAYASRVAVQAATGVFRRLGVR